MQALGQALAQLSALTYAASVLPGMVHSTAVIKLLGARRSVYEGAVTVTFLTSDHAAVQCFDVWVEDLGEGDFIYGEW